MILMTSWGAGSKRQDGDKTLRERKKMMWSTALLGFFYPESAKGLKLSAI